MSYSSATLDRKRNILFLPARLLLCLVLIGMVTASFVATSATAQTQLRPEQLVGDSVDPSELSNPRYSDISEAIKRYQLNDLLGATRFLEAAREKNKNLPPLNLLLAKLHYLSGNPAPGQVALEQAVTEDPTDPEPNLLIAEQAFSVGQTIVADALFDKAIQLAESYDANAKRKRLLQIRALAGRASVAQRRENWAQAEADLRKWLELDPENASAHERLGQVLFMQDRANDGYQSFVQAHKLNDKLPNPFVSAALLYDRLGKEAEAGQAFEKAYAENKTDETTLLAYAQWLIKEGKIPEAETVLVGAQKVAPKSPGVWLLSGVAAKMNGKAGPAEDYLMQALNLAPTNRDVYNQLALLLIEQPEQEKKARARDFAAINQQLNQQNADANVTLAWVLFQLDQDRQANQVLQNAVQLGGRGADASFLLAKLLVQRGDEDNAKRLLDSALNYQGIFIQRAEAQALRDTLN